MIGQINGKGAIDPFASGSKAGTDPDESPLGDQGGPVSQNAVSDHSTRTPLVLSRCAADPPPWHSVRRRDRPVNERSSLDDTSPPTNDRRVAVAQSLRGNYPNLPGADGGHRFVALPVHGIPPDHTLILFVSGPVNITHVMIRDKDPAIFGSTRGTLTLLQPAFDQQRFDRPTPPHISTGVERIA